MNRAFQYDVYTFQGLSLGITGFKSVFLTFDFGLGFKHSDTADLIYITKTGKCAPHKRLVFMRMQIKIFLVFYLLK
jgi:hypothetical protein